MNTSLISTDDGLKALALAIARNRLGPNDPIEEVLAAEGVSVDEFEKLVADPIFKQYVSRFTKEMTENGVSFRMKNRVLVEDSVGFLYGIVIDRDAPAAARIKAFETLARYAGYDSEMDIETKKALSAAGVQDASTGFHITFNIPNLPGMKDINGQAIPTSTTVDIGLVSANSPAALTAEFEPCDELDAEAEAYEAAIPAPTPPAAA